MKHFFNALLFVMLALPLSVHSATYYWDNNGTTAGFGTAGGTWTVPTVSQWSTDSSGAAAPGASITTTSADPVNFGITTNGLAAGTITISGSVTNGSITFGSTNGVVVLNGGTINLNGNIAMSAASPAATQIVNSAIVLVGSRQFGAVLLNERMIFNGTISGTSGSGLTADTGNGSGIITLNGTNSFPGNFTVGRGQVIVNSVADAGVNSSLGAGTIITMAYGGGQNPAFVYSGSSAGSMNRNFNLNGGSDYIISQVAPLTLSGTFSNIAAGFNATIQLSGDAGGGANINEISGTIVSGGVYSVSVNVQNLGAVGGSAEEGMWKLSGNNTYTGATSVANASTLIVAHNNALGATVGGVALTQNAQILLMNNIAVGAEALTLNSGQGASWNGQTGAALRNYQDTNSWAGLITLSAASTIAANSGSALRLSGGITGTQNLTFNAAGDITVTNTGISIGTGTLTKSGAGTLTLAATNTYSGATTISNGTLKAGTTGALSSNSTFNVVGGATLDLGGYNNMISSLSTVNNPGTITDSSSPGSGGTLRITNAMSGTMNTNVFTGSLGLQFFGGGTGNTILNVTTNTYSGGTILGNGSGSTSTRLLLGGGTLGAGSPGAITSGLYGKGPITIGAATSDFSQLYFSSALTVNYDFVVNSSRGTDIPGAFRVESSGIVLAGAINANLADAAFSANNTVGQTISVNGRITGSSGVRVLTTGNGGLTVTLNNAATNNSYQGATRLETANSILSLGNSNQIPNGASAGNVTNNGNLKMSGFTDTINGLSGTGIVDGVSGTPTLAVGDNNATSTFSGVITDAAGSLTIAKIGAGVLTLSGNNSYSGATTINDGTLKAGSTGAFNNTSSLLMTNGSGTLDLNGYNVSFSGSTLSSTTATIIDNASGSGTSTAALGTVSANVTSLIKDGPTRRVAITLSNNNAANNFQNGSNTFSGGLTLLHTASGTRLLLGVITAGAYGSGPITLGLSATDKAGLMFDTSNQTLTNDIVFNTGLGTDVKGIRIDSTGNVISGTITANLAPITFAAFGSGAVTLTGRQTGPNGFTVEDSTFGILTVTMSNAAANNNYAGPTVIAGTKGVLVLGAANQIPNGAFWGNVTNNGTFNLGGFSETINGLFGSGIVDGISGSPTLAVGDNNATSTFSGVIRNTAGALTLSKTGAGIVTLSGTNTFNGSITVGAGTLVLADGLSSNMNQVTTSGTGSSLILTNGARLFNTNGYSVGGNSATIALYSNTVWTLLRMPNNLAGLGGTSNRILVTGGGIVTNISFAGGNILALNGNYGAFQVTDGGKVYLAAGSILLGQGASADNTIFVGGSGASSYFSAATIQIPQAGSSGGRNGITVTNGTLDCFGGILLGRGTAFQNFVRVFANGVVNMNGSSLTLADAGASVGNVVTIDQGVMTNVNGIAIGNAAGANSNSISVINGGQLWNQGALHVGNSATSHYNSVSIGNSGAASFVSNTALNVGIVGSSFNSVTATNATWWSSAVTVGSSSTNNSMSVLANATLNLNAGLITVGVSPGTGNTFTVTGGLVTNVSQITVGSQNALYLNGGTLAAGANGNLLSGAGNAYIRSGGAIIDTVAFAATNTLILQEDTGSTGGGLTKRGSGTFTLLGANTYSGTTLVSNGLLRVNGSTAAGAVTVATGGTLGGTGTVGGAVTVDGAVAPGSDGIGRLTSSGSVTWNAGVTWPFQLGAGATNDRLIITGGNFTKGSGSGWAFDFVGTGVAGVYTLVTWSASTTFTNTDFSANNLSGSLAGAFSINGTELLLTLQSVTNLTWDTVPGNATITDGSGTWQVGVSNWYNGFNYDRIWLDGATANFGGGTAGTAGTVTLGSNIIVQAIIFTNAFAGDYTFDLSTNTLTLGGGGMTLHGGNPVFTNGTISLSAERIFTIDNTNTLTIASKITGAGGVFKGNQGALTLNNNSNDFTGRLYTQNGGSLNVSSISNSGVASAAGAGSLIEINQSGVLNYTGSGNASSDRTLTLGNASASGINHWLRNNGGGSLIFRGPFNNSRGFVNGFFVLGGTNTGANEISFNITNSVTNALGLVKEDAGTWTLTGTNTYTGFTTISAGTLVLKSSNSSPSYAISANAVLELSTNAAPGTTTNSGSGTLRIRGTSVDWNLPAVTFAMGSGGLIDIQSGGITFGFGNENWVNNLSDLNADGGVFYASEANVRVDALTGGTNGYIATGGAAGYTAFTLGVDNGSGTYNGRIQDAYASGNLVKLGTGTQTLSGSNVFSGITYVSNGTLRVNGSLLAIGFVQVASAGTLGGNGSVGNVLLRGGTISPGLSPGILSVSSLTMTSGTYRFEITNATGTAGVNWDLIRVASGSGDVTNLASSSLPIVIDLTCATASLTNFHGTNALSWTIIDAGNQVGFASNKYTISTVNFLPPQHYDGNFTVSSNAGDLILNFLPNTNVVDLGVSIGATTNFMFFGDTNAIVVVVTNHSGTVSGSYSVTNTLSPNVTYAVAYSTTNPSTFEVTYYTANGGVYSGGTYANGMYSGGFVTWTLGGLGSGSSTSLYLFATQSTFSDSTQQVNNVVTVTVTSPRTDTNLTNNTANTSFNTVGIPMLSTLAMLIMAGCIVYVFYRRYGRCSEVTG